MNLNDSVRAVVEGKMDDFDDAYNVWHKATVKLTKALERAAQDKRGVKKYKKALQDLENAIDVSDIGD